jgi:hypothetical protein
LAEGAARGERRDGVIRELGIERPHAAAAKAVVCLALLSVAMTLYSDSRLLPVFAFLFAGYGLAGAQLQGNPPPGLYLLELVVLFAVPVFTTYLSTGIFFGGGDTFAHIRGIDSLLAADAITGIGLADLAYVQYPAYHLVLGSLAEYTGLAPYDALILAGVVLVGTLMIFVYAAIDRLFHSNRIALGSAVSVSLLSIVTYYTVYFYPQSMALVLLAGGIYLYACLRTATDATPIQRHLGLAVVLVALMTVTHHLAFLLFGCGIVVVFAIAGIRWLAGPSDDPWFQMSPPRYVSLVPLLIGFAMLTSYWMYSQSQFIKRFVSSQQGGETASQAVGRVAFGVALEGGLGPSVDWLLSVDGMYFAGLLALIAIAIYEIVDYPRRYREQLTLLLAGLLLAVFLFPVPVSVRGLQRFQLIIVLFAVFPLGVAITRLVRVRGAWLTVALLLVATVGATSPFVAPIGNDIDALSTDERRIQTAYDETACAELGSAGRFASSYADTPVTTRALTLRAILAQGSEYDRYQTLRLRRDAVAAPRGILLVREEWTKSVVTTTGGSFVVSQDRFDGAIASRNKIYAANGVYGLSQSEDYSGVFGSR